MQCLCQALRIFHDRLFYMIADRRCRIDGNTVSRMDTGSLDMLHDTRNQDVRSITHSVDLDLLALQIFINKDRVILCNPVDDADEFLDLVIVKCNLHALSAEYIGRAHKHRIAQTVRHFLRFLRGKYRSACCSQNFGLLENLIEKLTILRSVDVLRLGSEDLHTHLHQALGQLDRSLSTKLHHRTVRLLKFYDGFHILRRQWLKVQLIRNIKVC